MFAEVNYKKEKRKRRFSQKQRKKTKTNSEYRKKRIFVQQAHAYEYGCDE